MEDAETMSRKLASMSEEELDRFEQYRRSHVSRLEVAKILRETIPSNHAISHDTLIVVAGLAKLYVGDLVRAARTDGQHDDTPISPQEYLVAARRLQQEANPCVGDQKRPRLNGPPVITQSELL